MKRYNVNIENIDYELLKKQKQVLIYAIDQTDGEANEALTGILNLLDAITDQIQDQIEIENADLLDDFDSLPIEVKEVLDIYCTGDNDYKNCKKLVKHLETIGYTCDYGLDGEPYNLRKL